MMDTFVPDPRSPVGRYPPLEPHQVDIVGDQCVICHQRFLVADVPATVAMAPADAEEAEKARSGKAYSMVGAVVHERCAWPGEGR